MVARVWMIENDAASEVKELLSCFLKYVYVRRKERPCWLINTFDENDPSVGRPVGGFVHSLSICFARVYTERRPYAKKPKLVPILRPGASGHAAWGLTVCGDLLYVVKFHSSAVDVYSAIEPDDYRHTIKMPSGVRACDIVSYNKPGDGVGGGARGHLYISDPFKRTVWLLTPDEPPAAFASVAANRLFVDYGEKQLLMTSPTELRFYGIGDRKEKQCIKLPSFMDAVHSVRTRDGRVLVCHTTQWGDAFHQVSEVNAEGIVTRVYGESNGGDIDRLSFPTYMDVDDKGRVFVVDRGNNRIVLLDAQLRRERILLDQSDGLDSPCTVRYLRRDRRLLIGNKTGSVNSYSLLTTRRKTISDIE